MKIPFIILPLLACISQINANVTIVDTDFTTATTMPAGWVSRAWATGDNTPLNPLHYGFSSEKGAFVNNAWQRNSLSYSLEAGSSISSANGASYVITFSTYAPYSNQQNLFYLSSGSYSIVIGNSYKTPLDCVSVGSLNNSAGDNFVSFASVKNPGLQPTVITGSDAIGSMVDVGKTLNYSLTLSSGLLTMTVSDGVKEYSNKYAVKSDFTFDKVGFINDGGSGSTGVRNLSITQQVPEASTASLGLLAMAGLLLRRRRI